MTAEECLKYLRDNVLMNNTDVVRLINAVLDGNVVVGTRRRTADFGPGHAERYPDEMQEIRRMK